MTPRTILDESPTERHTKAYLVGGGIASLASATYLIRDGGLLGRHITIFEESDVIGGSLDAAGPPPENGYSMRGGRMFTEEAYTCLLDLMAFVPSLTNPNVSLKDEFDSFNARVKSHSMARLVKDGVKLDASLIGLSGKDRQDLIEIMAASEESLGAKRIEGSFEPQTEHPNLYHSFRLHIVSDKTLRRIETIRVVRTSSPLAASICIQLDFSANSKKSIPGRSMR